MPYGGKHSRLCYDTTRKRLVHTGGDISRITDDGNNEVWAGDERGGWTLLATACGSAGDQYPARPDNCTWIYDSKRDRGIIMPGFFFGVAAFRRYCPSGATPVQSALAFNFRTNKWEDPGFAPPPWGYGGDTGANFGAYDPVADRVYRLVWDGGWGCALDTLDLGTSVWTRKRLGEKPYDGNIRNLGPTTSMPALDASGRSLYCIGLTSGPKPRPLWALLKVNVDTAAATLIWLPPEFKPPTVEGGGGTDVLLQFDPTHRVLLHPMIPNLGGEVLGMLIFDVDKRQWAADQRLPSTPPHVVGNVCGFDSDKAELVLMGGHSISSVLRPGTTLADPTVSWRYRYGSR